MLKHWILDADGEPVEAGSLKEWGRWFDAHPEARRVDATDMGAMGNVSTVFLGQDHSFGVSDEEPTPVLFESMVFGGPYDQAIQERYCTRAEALVGHALLVNKLEKRRAELLDGLEWGDDPELRDKALATVLRLRKHVGDGVELTAAELAAAMNKQGGVTARASGDTITITADDVVTLGAVEVKL